MSLRALALALAALCFAARAEAQEPGRITGPAATSRPAPALESANMDLERSVIRAIEANPQIQSAKLQIFGAQEGVRAAAGAFGPSGTATYLSRATNTKSPTTTTTDLTSLLTAAGAPPGAGRLTITGQTFTVGDAYIANLDLNVSQPLFTGFRLLSTFQKARLARDQADFLYRRTELVLIRSVQTAFLTLLKSRSDVKSNQDSVARLDSQLKVTKAFYDVGLRPRLDVLQAESDLASAEQGLLAAQNSVDIQLAQLNSLLNIPLEQNVDYLGELAQTPFKMTLQQALDEAYKFRPDIAIAMKSVEIAEKDAAIVLSPYLPQVRADYDYIRQGDKWWLRERNVAFSERHQFQLTFTWKAWDWGSTVFSYRQALDNVKKLQADLARLRLDVGAEVKTQYLNIQDAAKRIAVARTGLTAAQEGYRMAVARYQAQVGTNTDVLDAQARVSRAEFQLTQALTDYQIAIANLNFSIGRKSFRLDG